LLLKKIREKEATSMRAASFLLDTNTILPTIQTIIEDIILTNIFPGILYD